MCQPFQLCWESFRNPATAVKEEILRQLALKRLNHPASVLSAFDNISQSIVLSHCSKEKPGSVLMVSPRNQVVNQYFESFCAAERLRVPLGQCAWDCHHDILLAMADGNADTTQIGTLTQPKVEGLYMALELMELGYELVRQRFIRENPDADEDAVRRHLNAWIGSPRNGAGRLKKA